MNAFMQEAEGGAGETENGRADKFWICYSMHVWEFEWLSKIL